MPSITAFTNEKIKKKLIILIAAILLGGLLVFLLLNSDGRWFQTTMVPQTSKELINKMKTKGCVADGLLTGYGGDFNDKVRMLKNSQCEFLHRSIETWNNPPNFDLIKNNISTIEQSTGKHFIYSLFIAESINFKSDYSNDSNEKFNFEAMCQPGTEGAWGPDTCKPSLNRPEYQRYVKYITQKAIDLGVKDIVFGQIYYQDNNWQSKPKIKDIVSDIRIYAASKNKEVAIGAQTNTIDDEKYLRNFDYITGGIGQDENTGYIEDTGPCWSYYLKHSNYCWAMLWNEKYKSKANNVFVYLDWNNDSYDDMNRFVRLSDEKRRQFLGRAYDFLLQKDVGFLLPLEAVLDGSGRGCYGAEPHFYSASNAYSCRDENAINTILSRKGFLPERAEFINQSTPLKMETGKKYDINIIMKNNSLLAWSPEDKVQLGAQNPSDNMTWGINRIALKETINPGEKYEFKFYVIAPTKPGKYNFQWRMVKEENQWFGQPSNNLEIQVLEPAIPLSNN